MGGSDPKSYIFVAVVTVLATIVTTWIMSKVTRRGQSLDNEVKVVDNYQEDIDAMRKEITSLKGRLDLVEKRETRTRNEAHRVVDEARRLYYKVEEEVILLRQGFIEGTIPPLPERTERPPFPVLVFTKDTNDEV